MTDETLVLGIAGLSMAAILVIYLVISGGKSVPMSRRRPRDAASGTALSRAADRATAVAARALGNRAASLERSLETAGVPWRPQDLLVVVGSAILAFFALGLVLRGPVAAVLLAFAAPLGAVVLVRVLTARRRRAFALQLDETLAILAGGLHAGYSLPQAAATVAIEAESPTGEVFTRVINENRIGRPFIEALEDAADRMQNDDFVWVAQAIAINREVGGNLAGVLEGVAETIRERTHLRRQVESLAAEGRLSAIILAALPFVVFFALSLFNPGYMSRFGESLIGVIMLAVAGVLLGVGLLWLRSAVRIKF